MKRTVTFILVLLTMALGPMAQRASAISFALDSIATWGKFPRFVVNTYRWGDRFFNGYDTTYVAGTGYKFNAKLTTDSWTDAYHFRLPNDKDIFMLTDPATSAGIHLTYLAVSAGYDVNIGKLLTGKMRARKRFRFGFNCMLFAAEFYVVNNDGGTMIKQFGDYKRLKYDFNGMHTSTWGVDAYYFFNHKRYSEAASFNFSRLQRRSQGAFYTGFSIYTDHIDFDFGKLPSSMLLQLPDDWTSYRYYVNTHNYAIRFGYGYNWVFAPKWVLGVSESPIVGVRKGFVNSDIEKVSLSLYNRAKVSVAWNNGRWFFGAVGKFDLAIVNDQLATYSGAVLSAEAVFGYRFNLW